MKLLEIFDKSDVPDRYRFVFDEVHAEALKANRHLPHTRTLAA